MPGDDLSGTWIPLMDFAMRRGVSLSTLRRQIKANKVRYRLERGRYLLFDELRSHAARGPDGEELGRRLRAVEGELERAREEIAELKMLVALYEEQIHATPLGH